MADMGNIGGKHIHSALCYGGDYLSETEFNEKQLLRMSQVAEGIDPDASQMMTDFMDMKNVIERSNLPTTDTVLCMAGLDVAGQIAYRSRPDNIFFMFRDSLARAYMARNGEKSKQVVDLWKQTPDVIGLQTTPANQQRGLIDTMLGRSKEE